MGNSLSKRLFTTRLELLGELDQRVPTSKPGGEAEKTSSEVTTEAEVRQAIAKQLQTEVAAMNLENFVVRPQRQLVETYTDPKAWQTLKSEQFSELANNVAGLPTELPTEDEEAKRFDLLMLRLQLARLQTKPEFIRLSQQVRAIADIALQVGFSSQSHLTQQFNRHTGMTPKQVR
ncbi:AraC family transcriptional regulator [Geitlerinema splendidum]|nr:AraC family transcriptional regulator [Geitlerinema splendidum]